MSSGVLQSFDIPVVDFDTCLEKAPLEFGVKIVDDKVWNLLYHNFLLNRLFFAQICAGYVNSNENLSKVVCKGDSGGGLLIPQTVRKEKRYYLQGVVSNSQSTKNCDTSFYTLFTNVQYYKNMIKKALSKN